jgi:lysophospholipase L1-like esterase
MANNNTTFPGTRKISLVLLICCLFISFSATSYSANIIAFGDSITYGRSSRTGGYPPKLKSLLNANGKPSNVLNKGISGEMTPAGVARFDSVLNSWPSDIILIMEGTNDIWRGLSVQTTQRNLQAMINKAKAKGVTPVIATLTPSNKNGSQALIQNVWNPMIKNLAANNGVILSDHYTGINPTWGSSNADGLHPNDRGYQTIANTWYGSIAGLISFTGEVGSGESSGSGGSSGCFIATAAFGSPVEKNVELLKEFRDKILLPTAPGKKFVKAYYRYSPPVADFIRDHQFVKLAVRMMLYPLIGLSFFLVKLSLWLQVTLVLSLSALVAGSEFFLRRHTSLT